MIVLRKVGGSCGNDCVNVADSLCEAEENDVVSEIDGLIGNRIAFLCLAERGSYVRVIEAALAGLRATR